MLAVSISVLQGNRLKGIYLEVLAHVLTGLSSQKSGQLLSGLDMQVTFHPVIWGVFFHMCI